MFSASLGIMKVIEKSGNISYTETGDFNGNVMFGMMHRKGTPALLYPVGTSEWFDEGKAHREDGPAVLGPDGGHQWWRNGHTHREGAPARIYPDGHLEWWHLGRKQEPGGHRPSRHVEWSPERTQT